LKDDPRWKGYDVPPKSNANYAWPTVHWVVVEKNIKSAEH
jgi:hypothetical protein